MSDGLDFVGMTTGELKGFLREREFTGAKQISTSLSDDRYARIDVVEVSSPAETYFLVITSDVMAKVPQVLLQALEKRYTHAVARFSNVSKALDWFRANKRDWLNIIRQ